MQRITRFWRLFRFKHATNTCSFFNMNVNLTAFINSLGVCIAHFLISFPLSVSDVIKDIQQNHRKIFSFPVLKLLTCRLPVNFSSQSDFDSSAF